ncbi:MAG: sterol desaturase family protein [Chitinophagales bacterium]|nr:sterol desaturase family protein [Chitinophagales bacterium]
MQTAVLTQRNFFNLHKSAPFIDWVIVALVFLSGLLHPSPKVFYDSVLRIFLIITVPLFTFAFLIYRFSEKYGNRIQGERGKNPPIAEEAFGSARAMFVVACMAAWPTGMYRIGLPTGIVWTIKEMGLNWWLVVLEMYAGIIAVDALTYWKHRLLHTKMFFPFHKHHHSFRDPTPFAGFAVGPLETVLTFFPLLFICFPPAKHFAPLYFSAIVGFVFLNLYLHCGVTFSWLEKILPRIGLNSSAWHNVHHSDVNANFGEVSFIWDKVCKTTRADYEQKRSAAIS